MVLRSMWQQFGGITRSQALQTAEKQPVNCFKQLSLFFFATASLLTLSLHFRMPLRPTQSNATRRYTLRHALNQAQCLPKDNFHCRACLTILHAR